LAVATTYYVGWTGSTGAVKLATTFKNLEDGIYVDITDEGSGVHTVTAEKMGAVYEIYPLVITGSSYYNRVLLDDKSQVWVERTSTSTYMKLTGMGSGAIRSIAVWKNYILVFHNQSIDAFGPVNGNWSTGSWKNAFATLESDTTSHPSVIMSNDTLYIGGSNYVASLTEDTTFDPSDSGTFSFNPQALDLPAGEKIYALDELNFNLMIGTGNGKEGKIYSWDTFSPSYSGVLKTSVSYVATMKVVNNILYFFDNLWGTIYATNGISIQKIKDFPEGSAGIQQVYFDNPLYIFPRSHALAVVKDKILVGVGTISTGMTTPGIYSYNLQNGALTLEYSAASNSTTANITFYALYSVSLLQLLAGVYDSSLSSDYRYKLENTYISNYYRNTTSYLETGLMTVGTKYQPKTFRFFEIQTGKELASGEAITLYYRNNLTDSYTTIGSMSYANDGAIATKIIENSSVSGDQIQFKVLFTCGNSATTGPELKSIYIY